MNLYTKSNNNNNKLTPASPLPPILENHPQHHPNHQHQHPPHSYHPPPGLHVRYHTHPDDYPSQHLHQQHRPSTMERDSKSPSKRGESLRPVQPLRRGDACLMCRAKKLKCSASKPICDQCTKRKDRCVYDAVRPASRVEKLEKKLAEIEEQELRAALAQRKQSAETSIPSTYPSLQPSLTPSFDMSMYQFQPQQPVNSFPTTEARPQSMPTPQVDPLSSWNWSDTGFSSLPSTSPAIPLESAMPWSLLSSSNDVSFWDGDSLGVTNPTVSPATEPTPSSLYGIAHDLPSLGALNMNNPLFPPIASSMLQPEISALPGVTPSDARAAVDDVLNHAAGFAVQLDEKDISQSARDYLLDLFFCPPRERWGAEVFSEAQFRAKMLLPPRSRPHPGLVFAMYTLAASSSYIPAVRALAESLYEIAKSKVEASVVAEDRLLDAINACKMLSKWLCTKARALEAHHMSWRASGLALACELHKIPSSIVPVQPAASTSPWPLIGPPKDQWDMCERIHAFWSTWGNDRGAAVAMPWPTGMKDETILTPLPRHPDDYMNGPIHRVPDFYIRDIYLLPHRPDLEMPTYPPAILCIATHLVVRAKHLAENQTEHDQSFLALGAQQAPKGRFHARRDAPRAYKELSEAIDAVLFRMPSNHRINLLETPPWSNAEVPLTHVLLLAAKYMLHDNDTDNHDREIALTQAKELAGIIRLWIKQLKYDELRDTRNVKFNSKAPTACGCAETYVLTPWYWAADWLVRGAKVLRGQIGRQDEAQSCEDDAAMIVSSLKSLGAMYPPVTENADLVEKASRDLDL
ncbi:hypothetical protein BCR39DRAFT_470688 [Naematelia encephala]|uniref:Zn(2)-C6 fungal-type domain-containing protein n=1 Tax=Naematelia encephala TaxID=71784 RepID=A0A1Y2AV23_9TREE|nr:hypothetical protein BCR39DRAFT_470688 [Naematelia encephala]